MLACQDDAAMPGHSDPWRGIFPSVLKMRPSQGLLVTSKVPRRRRLSLSKGSVRAVVFGASFVGYGDAPAALWIVSPAQCESFGAGCVRWCVRATKPPAVCELECALADESSELGGP